MHGERWMHGERVVYAGWRNVPYVTAFNCNSARTVPMVSLRPTVPKFEPWLFFSLGISLGKSVFFSNTTKSVIWRMQLKKKLLLSPLPYWEQFGSALKNYFNLVLPVTEHICLASYSKYMLKTHCFVV